MWIKKGKVADSTSREVVVTPWMWLLLNVVCEYVDGLKIWLFLKLYFFTVALSTCSFQHKHYLCSVIKIRSDWLYLSIAKENILWRIFSVSALCCLLMSQFPWSHFAGAILYQSWKAFCLIMWFGDGKWCIRATSKLLNCPLFSWRQYSHR